MAPLTLERLWRGIRPADRMSIVRQRLNADERREKIVGAARLLFAERGYEATRVEEIAQAAGCSTGPVYHFFGNKREIFAAALRGVIRDAGESMTQARAAIPERSSCLDRLILSCEHLLGLLSHRETASFTLEAPRVLGDEDYRTLFDNALRPIVEADLRAAMVSGEIEAEDPEPLAIAVAGAILACGTHIAAVPGDATADELSRHTATLRRLLERLRAH